MRGCLAVLCFYHSVILGRRRFGQSGWSRPYSFNMGDLKACSDVLVSYLEVTDDVPWDDLRYIFGEIMYGGHITDAWDRRTNNTYLAELMKPELRPEGEAKVGLELGPGFPSPDPTTFDYEGYAQYIDTKMPKESPPLFGLHPNAEIGYLTSSTANLFSTIVSLGGGGGGGGGAGDVVKATMADLSDRCPEELQMVLIDQMAEPLLAEPSQGPYVVVLCRN